MNTPDIDKLGSCMDGIGAEIPDAKVTEVPKEVASRKYKVRYYIPTVSSTFASEKSDEKVMSVETDSAEDAVRATKAAAPDASIISVER